MDIYGYPQMVFPAARLSFLWAVEHEIISVRPSVIPSLLPSLIPFVTPMTSHGKVLEIAPQTLKPLKMLRMLKMPRTL